MELERESIEAIKEAEGSIGVLWSGGKDSTVLLWLCRKAFNGEVPFPVVYVEAGRQLHEVLEFRDRLAGEWKLDLKVVKGSGGCCGEALPGAVGGLGLDAVLAGSRDGEECALTTGSGDVGGVRVSYPLRRWSELDVWRYVKAEGVPVPELYLSKGGRRCVKVGCAACGVQVESDAATVDGIIKELESKTDSEEDIIVQRLKSLGYM